VLGKEIDVVTPVCVPLLKDTVAIRSVLSCMYLAFNRVTVPNPVIVGVQSIQSEPEGTLTVSGNSLEDRVAMLGSF
jgi:hypothetical protein